MEDEEVAIPQRGEQATRPHDVQTRDGSHGGVGDSAMPKGFQHCSELVFG